MRSYKIDGVRYCIHCGEELGEEPYCLDCRTLYPDYCVIQSNRLKRRSVDGGLFSFDIAFNSPKKNAGFYLAGASDAKKSDRDGGKSSRWMFAAIAVAVVVAVVAVGVVLYKRNKLEDAYVKNYVVALYGIKSGLDQSIKKADILASGIRLSDKDMMELQQVKREIDAVRSNLEATPERFSTTVGNIDRLYGHYTKALTLVSTASPDPAVLASAQQLSETFEKQAKGQMDGLPPEIKTKISDSVSKFKNLGFLVE